MSRYAEISELHQWGAPASAYASTTTDPVKLAALSAASGELDAAAKSQGAEIVSVPDDVKQKICHIAAYELLAATGFNPTAGADQNLLMRAQMARDYFKGIARGEQKPAIVYAPTRRTAQPSVSSKPLRGW